MNRIEFESLMKVINYLKEDEQKNYEECETPDTMHIWNDIKVLMDYAQVHQFTLNNAEEALASVTYQEYLDITGKQRTIKD
tara:strand:- start:545 stop:787 length:243 start_codon:yes stop_codon:yes gene_type:complete